MSSSLDRRQFAREVCLPYLITLERFRDDLDLLSFMLVGSVATGHDDENSDVDVAVVCERRVYDSISGSADWDRGRPTEEHLDGVQLQYYGISFEQIEKRLSELDDVYLHVYSNAISLRDPNGQYFERLAPLLAGSPDVRRERVEGKLDMLVRRACAMRQAIQAGDIMSIAQVCLELLRRGLELIALLDGVDFDPRKRLFMTALRGELGRELEPVFRRLVSSLGELGDFRDSADLAHFSYPSHLDGLVAALSDEARGQGFRVGLQGPDLRQV